MSEIATEVNGSGETVTTVEFLGTTFQDRKDALDKIDMFRAEARQALVDSVSVLVGRAALATFRPSSVTYREWKLSVPCYGMLDKERTPIERNVTIHSINTGTETVRLGEGEYLDNSFEQTWNVKLTNILNIALEEIEGNMPTGELS